MHPDKPDEAGTRADKLRQIEARRLQIAEREANEARREAARARSEAWDRQFYEDKKALIKARSERAAQGLPPIE